MLGKRRRLQKRNEKEWIFEVAGVKGGVVEVVLGVVVEEEGVVGVDGKENLIVYVGCNNLSHI
jgi:hypothetical protein